MYRWCADVEAVGKKGEGAALQLFYSEAHSAFAESVAQRLSPRQRLFGLR